MTTADGNLDWEGLLQEFEAFEVPEDFGRMNCKDFVEALMDPLPCFVDAFLARKSPGQCTRGEAVRALYCFFLEKRYQDRLNLLYFAFNIFDTESPLPKEIIDRTPFPHEDGIPCFRHINEPGFELGPFRKTVDDFP